MNEHGNDSPEAIIADSSRARTTAVRGREFAGEFDERLARFSTNSAGFTAA